MSIDINATLDAVVSLKLQIKQLSSELDTHLDALREAVDTGDLDPQFSHNDTKFNLSPGRTTYTYPPAVTELSLRLKDAQSQAIADGTAIQKVGEPFWTIKLPR